MSKIIVVGMGPGGGREYVLPIALKTVESARVLVGGRRLLADFARADQITFPITGDLPAVLNFLRRELAEGDVVVMTAGDPGYYSLLDTLRREFPPQQIMTIPGISSLSLAFARLSLPWHDAVLASFHGREPTAAQIAFAPGKILGLLTDGQNNSQTIAAKLLRLGWPTTHRMFILERLGYPDEQITAASLGEAAANAPIGHGVLIVAAKDAANC